MGNPTNVGDITQEQPFQSQLMDKDALCRWVLRRLGAPLWKVELTAEHIKDAIEEACRWFAAKKGAFRVGIVTIQPGVVEYNMSNEVDVVLDVHFTSPESDLSLIFSPFLILDEKVPYDVFAAPQSIGLYSSYVQTLQYIEQAKRVLSAELDWEQRGRCLWVSPTPRQTANAIIEFKSSVFKIETLPERDHYLIRQYALAFALIDLGSVRSKYQGFPGAQGDTQLNGEALIQRGTDMLEKLNEEIILSGYPMKFTTG
jgi:hypothetical protein